MVVEVPHAGLELDVDAEQWLLAPEQCRARDADLYVDELYADAPSLGATLLVARVSRYVCDLNRSESDFDARAVEGATGQSMPHGLIWHTTTDGKPTMRGPLGRAELDRRLTAIYRPYHERLWELLSRKRERFGFAVLLCGHSMPSRARVGPRGSFARRADVVPGSRGFTSAAPVVIEMPAKLARARGWTTAHDSPYRGGFTTGHYGRPSEHLHAVQVELSRRLYMDERSLERKRGAFEETRDFCGALVRALGALSVGP